MDNEKKRSYASNSTYLHNTKITSSDIQQESKKKAQKSNAKHPDGRCAALTEMLQIMLRYPEVYMILRLVPIYKIPLEIRVLNNIILDAKTNDDGFFVTCISDQVCFNKEDLPNWRQHSAN